jgi:hypothetical protein
VSLYCGDCPSLSSLPALPECMILWCNDLPHLTQINVPDNCNVYYDNSPISGHNNDLYLSYVNARHPIITTSIDQCHNYDSNIISIITGYL